MVSGWPIIVVLGWNCVQFVAFWALQYSHLKVKCLVFSQDFNHLYVGLCFNSEIDWNYYLTRKNGQISYEGYKNSEFVKDSRNWVIGERLPLRRSVASLTLKSDERVENHPVGVYLADVLDKNG